MKTLAKDVYAVIRHRVANGKLRPGVRVSELGLSKELGVSRAPVREAIGKLTTEGLLERMPDVGTFVKKPSRAELQDLYELRGWLEGEAAAKAASMISEESVQRLKKCCDEMQAVVEMHRRTGEQLVSDKDYERLVTADLSFHFSIAKACCNEQALDILANRHLLSRTWATALDQHDLGLLVRCHQDHMAIFQAIQSREPKLARRLLREHIDQGMRSALAGFDRREAASLTGLKDQEALEDTPKAIKESLRRLEERHIRVALADSDDPL